MTTVSRRRFVQGAGAAGVALLAGCGQVSPQRQPAKPPRIGYLRIMSPAGTDQNLDTFQQRFGAFLEGLSALGYVEGQNLIIETRATDGTASGEAAMARELARLPVDVIVTSGSSGVTAAQQATGTIPIVIAQAGDPVELGFVASLARPGGNITGLSNASRQLAGKRLALLKETVPQASVVGVLRSAGASPSNARQWGEVETLAPRLGVELRSLELQSPADLGVAFETASREPLDGLLVLQSFLAGSQQARIIEFARKSRLPTMCPAAEWGRAGGLIAYGPNQLEMFRRAATYVDKILKGAKPADLPIEQPMTFDFVINLRTAQALGLTIPPAVLAQATEVIR
jgi:putative ABC transport system substrate-binding protein